MTAALETSAQPCETQWSNAFYTRVLERVILSLGNAHDDNIDLLRFPELKPTWHRWLWSLVHSTGGFVLPQLRGAVLQNELAALHIQMREMNALWSRLNSACQSLEDARSRELMIELFVFRLLGPRRVRLSTNCSSYRQQIDAVLALPSRIVPVPTFFTSPVLEFDCSPVGWPVSIVTHPLGVVSIFLQEQYALRRRAESVCVRPGDVVVDLGCCWGDSTLYFALEAGKTGRVIGLEFVPENVSVLTGNLRRNAKIAERVEIDQRAAWSTSNDTLGFTANGPGTVVANRPGVSNIQTVTLDDLLLEKHLERVDFV